MVERKLANSALQAEPDEALAELVKREKQRHGSEQKRARLTHMTERRHANRSDHATGDKAGRGRKAHAVFFEGGLSRYAVHPAAWLQLLVPALARQSYGTWCSPSRRRDARGRSQLQSALSDC